MRLCFNLVLKFGGKNCFLYGLEIDVESCYLILCFLDGGYSMWLNFIECIKLCNVGRYI